MTADAKANATDSPYVFVKSSGLAHVKLRNGSACVGDVRLDVFEIVWTEAYRAGYLAGLGAAREAAERSVAK